MKAKDLAKLLSVYPDAEVQVAGTVRTKDDLVPSLRDVCYGDVIFLNGRWVIRGLKNE